MNVRFIKDFKCWSCCGGSHRVQTDNKKLSCLLNHRGTQQERIAKGRVKFQCPDSRLLLCMIRRRLSQVCEDVYDNNNKFQCPLMFMNRINNATARIHHAFCPKIFNLTYTYSYWQSQMNYHRLLSSTGIASWWIWCCVLKNINPKQMANIQWECLIRALIICMRWSSSTVSLSRMFIDHFSSLNLSDAAVRSSNSLLFTLWPRHNTLSLAPSVWWCWALSSDQFIAAEGLMSLLLLSQQSQTTWFISRKFDLKVNDAYGSIESICSHFRHPPRCMLYEKAGLHLLSAEWLHTVTHVVHRGRNIERVSAGCIPNIDLVCDCCLTLDFVDHCMHVFTYLAESPLDHKGEEARVWALELHSSFCYSLLLCPSVVQQTA